MPDDSEFLSVNISEKKEEAKNKVHQDAIHQETIRKEQRHQTLYTNFTINPLKKLHVLSDKPTASKPKETMEKNCKFTLILFYPGKALNVGQHLSHHHVSLLFPAELIEAFHLARQVPTKKYPEPVTESHEIGWSTEPLIPSDRFDRRFNHHRQRTDITRDI
ncbi:cilia- and flagella-associated protein 144-like [Platichthys flesus]|uniref:cilia- and flagella-associated protein 144-like n=1 Tax=Platichthys flesus TaxID=8260 RepID=UPI002DBD84E8|nr:cilia- and flagella-associated protein 144-like [Platichthys flesus]